MSQPVADQLFLAYMGRPADIQWRSATSTITTQMGDAPSAALLAAFYSAAIAEGVFSTADSTSTLVNKIFLNQFGFAASEFEKTAWGNLITNGTISAASAAWTIFVSYLGATNVPPSYQLPAQSKLVAMAVFSDALTDPAANVAYSQLNSSAAAAGRAYLAVITSQTTAATAIAGVVATVASLSTVKTATFTLTSGIDNVQGTTGSDTINASTADTWSASDTIDGAAGIDTLTATLTGVGVPAGVTVTNVETINITTTGVGFTVDTAASGYTGLTQLNVTDSVSGAISVTSANTTALGIVATGASTVDVVGGGGAVSITTGAGAVNLGQTAVANAVTSVAVVGGTTVNLQDRSGASAVTGSGLTSVSLNGNTGAASLVSNGLTSLSLTSEAQNATVTAAAGARALTVNLNGVTGGAITDATATTVSVRNSGAVSSGVSVSAASATSLSVDATGAALTLADASIGSATSLTISGSANVVINSLSSVASLTSVNASGSTASVSLVPVLAVGVSYTGGSGIDTISTSTGATVAIATGAGNDFVTYGGPVGVGGSINGGANTDTISMTAVQAVTATGSAAFATAVTGFEVLSLSAATGAATAINMANAGVNNLSIAGATGAALTVTNAAADFTLTQRGATTFDSSVGLAVDTGGGDNVNLAYIAANGFTSTATITIANVESLKITTTDADAVAQTALIVTPLTATAATTVTVAGNMGVSLIGGMTQTALTSLDASGLTTSGIFGGLTWTSGALAAPATVKGSAAGTDTLDLSAATAAVTLTLGTGGSTVKTGLGNDTITIGAATGVNNVNVGSGTDTVILNGIQTTFANMTIITGMSSGDKINLFGVKNGATITAQIAMGTAAVASPAASLATGLSAATAGNGSVNTIFKWFQFAGSTYIVEDTSAAGTFQNGSDTVVQLVGLIDLTSATITSGVITLA